MKRLKFLTNYHVGGVWYEKGSTHDVDDTVAVTIDPANIQHVSSEQVVTPPVQEEVSIETIEVPTAAEKEHTKPVKRIRRK